MNNSTKLRMIAYLAALSFPTTALADKLCLQTTVNKKNLKVTSNRIIAAACPRGFTELLDTTTFKGPAGSQGDKGASGPQGPKGDTGNPGFSYSTCTKKVVSHSYTISNTSRQVPDMSGSCDKGSHLIRLDLWYQVIYSADYSLDMNPSDEVPPDTSLAGTTSSSLSRNYRPNAANFWVVDQEEIFLTGVNESANGGVYSEGEVLTGLEQHTREHRLICCKLGE